MAYILGILIVSCLTGFSLAQVKGMYCQNVDAANVLQWCDSKCCGDRLYEYCCEDELQTGAIVGIVFGVIGFLIIVVVIVLLLYFCWYKRRDSGYQERGTFARYSEKPPPTMTNTPNPEYDTKAYTADEVKKPPKDYDNYETKTPKRDDYYDDEYDDGDDYDEYDDYKTEPRAGRPEDKRKSTRRYEDDAPDGGYISELKTKIRDSKFRYDVDDEEAPRVEQPRARNDEYRAATHGTNDHFRGYKHSQSSV